MIKTVYGPPPTDVERIEAAEVERENCIREEEEQQLSAAPKGKTRKGADGQ